MAGFAWVTLATNDSYSLGALVLANSLRQVNTSHQLAVLVTPGVTGVMRQKLAAAFNVVKEVNILDSQDEANLRLLQRPELGITFTKLHCWRLTQFEKCVFLDADTLVLANADELFEREEFSAAPDVGWPDCFNSGVFVYRPSEETYGKLVQFALEKGSFDGGDQGLLNLYFSDWAYKDISKHLPFIYNMCSTACYSYLPAFKQFGPNVKIIHFIGNAKPWLQYFDTETRQVHVTSDLQHLSGIVQHWWNIFCSSIHSTLSPEMAPSSAFATHLSFRSNREQPPLYHNPSYYDTLSESACITQYQDSKSDYRNVWDPWDDYEKNRNEISDSHHSNTEHAQYLLHDESKPVSETCTYEQIPAESCQSDNKYTHNISSHNAEDSSKSHFVPCQTNDQINIYDSENNSKVDTSEPRIQEFQHACHIEPTLQSCNPEVSVISNTTAIHTPECNQLAWSHECEPTSSVTNESALHDNPSEANDSSAGLAGAFARLTLGVRRTAEQSSLEDHLRRQGWEVGNIDYMGRDSFDNIWSKICQTLASPLSAEPAVSPQSETAAVVAPLAAVTAPPAAAPSHAAAAQTQQIVEPVKTPETDSVVKEPTAKTEAAAPVEAPPTQAATPPEAPKPVESHPVPIPTEATKIHESAPSIKPAESVLPSEPLKPADLCSKPSEPSGPPAATIESKAPVTPEPKTPAVPEAKAPAASECKAPPSPEEKAPQVPEAIVSEAKALPAPEAKAPSAPEAKGPSPPEAKAPPAPEAKAPPAPEAKAPPAPEAKAPPASEAKAPPAPKDKAPSTPEAKAPPAPEAKAPEPPKPTVPSAIPSTPPEQPKAPAASKPESEKKIEASGAAPASGKQDKAPPEGKVHVQSKPESQKSEAAAVTPKSSKTPPTSPLPGSQQKPVPLTKEPASPTPETSPSAEPQAASGAQGPTPPPRKTGSGGGSKKGGKGKK